MLRLCIEIKQIRGAYYIRKTYLDYLKCLQSNRQRNGLFDQFDLFRNNMTIECLFIVKLRLKNG